MRVIRKLLRQHKYIIIAVIFCLTGFGGLLFGVVPAAQAALEAIQDIRNLDVQITRLSKKVTSLNALSEDTLKNQLTVITTAIPIDKSVPSIFSAVDSTAAFTGVSVVDMSITQAGSLSTASAQKLTSDEKKLGASIMPFMLTVQGPFESISSFIGRIGAVRRLVRVKNFDVSLLATGAFQARLSLDAFYVPLPTTLSKADELFVDLTAEEQAVLATLASYPFVSGTVNETIRRPQLGTKQNPFAR